MRILVFGSNGMAGHVVANHFKQSHDVKTAARSNADYIIDCKNENSVDLVLKNNFDIIINCIGVLVKNSEDDPVSAIYANALFPKLLEQKLKNTNTKLIHISTDCVFSGKSGPYKDSDPKDGIGIYAQTKSIGEIINKKDLTIRTSIIGPELKNGTGLLNWVLNSKGKIFGYDDHIWSGVTTLQLAKIIEAAIKQNLNGLYQIPGEQINKFELLKLIKEVFNLKDLEIERKSVGYCNKSLLRSENQSFDYIVPTQIDSLLEIRNYITSKSYQHY